MNLISWVLTLSFIVGACYEAVLFYQGTVCRQTAWLKSTEIVTRAKMTSPQEKEVLYYPKCQLNVIRAGNLVRWRTSLKRDWHYYELKLIGKI
jgi:hypothetical protein